MGISISAWRATIGLHFQCALVSGKGRKQVSGLGPSEASCLFLLLFLVVSIFVIGKIELGLCIINGAVISTGSIECLGVFWNTVNGLLSTAFCESNLRPRRRPTSCLLSEQCLGACGLYFLLLLLLVLLFIGNIELNPGPDYKCKVCNVSSVSLHACATHQRESHAMDSKFFFSCPVIECQHIIFMNYNSLRVHIAKVHSRPRTNEDNFRDVGGLPCSAANCAVRVTSLKAMCHHLISDHGKEGTAINCPFRSCTSVLQKSSSFRVHLSSYHPGWHAEDEVESVDAGIIDPPIIDYHNDSINCDDTGVCGSSSKNDESMKSESDDELAQLSENFYLQVAKFYLKMESECMLPASSVQTLSEGLQHLLQLNAGIMKKAIVTELKELNITEEEQEHILINILSSDKLYCAHVHEAPGPTFNTIALRSSYYKKKLSYVEHTEKNLSDDPNDRRCVYLFPIKKTLKVLLSCPSIQKNIDKSFQTQEKNQNSDDVLHDYRDGYVYKNGESADIKTIDLILFQDSFNPLKDMSSVAEQYDTLGMYMCLGNLKPHLRSKLKAMQAVMIIPKFKGMWRDFKDRCFEPVVHQLKKLETEGILYKGEKVKVVVQFILGDNKGQNQIGGFVDSFTALYYCRFCTMSRDEIRNQPWELRPLRTKEDIIHDLRLYQEAVARGERDVAHVNGVKGSCPFDALKYFNSSDPRLCPCLAHDIFEAIVDKYDMQEIIEHLITSGWFTQKTLNRLIRRFHYSAQDLKNKPAQLKDSKIGGHAIQNWTFLRLLPFILGKERILDPSDSHWKLYLDLKEITEYVCAPSISTNQIADLKILVEDYLHDRQEVLATQVKPKHHFLNHYADLMFLMGPIIHLFTMRFESMHKFFKSCARASKNVINLGVTMSKKASLYFCYLSTGFFVSDGVHVPDGKKLCLETHDAAMQSVLLGQAFSPTAEEVCSITVGEVNYSKGQWLLLGNEYDNDSATVVLGNVKCLVVDGTTIGLVVEKHIAKRWVDYGVYKIASNDMTKPLICLHPEDLKYPISQSIYTFGGYPCFSIKHVLSVKA